MWTWTLNWNEIRPDILVGSCPMRPRDLDRILAEAAATAVLSLQHPECHAHYGIDYGRHVEHGRQAGLVMLNTPLQDFDVPDQRRNLPRAVSGLHGLLTGGHRVYVHCTAGINRAPLTVLGYLTWVEGMELETALGLIQQARPEAFPYLEAYEGCEHDLRKRYHKEIEERTQRTLQANPRADPEAIRQQVGREIIKRVLTRVDY